MEKRKYKGRGKIDGVGRIVIQKDLLTELGWSEGTRLIQTLRDGGILSDLLQRRRRDVRELQDLYQMRAGNTEREGTGLSAARKQKTAEWRFCCFFVDKSSKILYNMSITLGGAPPNGGIL